LITIKLIGGAKKSFSTDKIILEQNVSTINELISHLMQIKPKDTLEFDTNNLLIAVNGVDSSALQGYDTKLNATMKSASFQSYMEALPVESNFQLPSQM